MSGANLDTERLVALLRSYDKNRHGGYEHQAHWLAEQGVTVQGATAPEVKALRAEVKQCWDIIGDYRRQLQLWQDSGLSARIDALTPEQLEKFARRIIHETPFRRYDTHMEAMPETAEVVRAALRAVLGEG